MNNEQIDILNTNKSEYCYEQIKKMIISNELPGGSFLVERQLSAMLGFSRTTIRHALQELVKDNLVTSYPNRGMVVTPITIEDVIEIYQIRESLDVLALRLYLSKQDREMRIAQLQSHLDSMRESLESSDHKLYIEQDLAFHSCYLKDTGNGRLETILHSLWNQMSHIILSVTSISRLYDSQKEHEYMMEALHKGDIDGACNILQQHIRLSKAYHIERMTGISLI